MKKIIKTMYQLIDDYDMRKGQALFNAVWIHYPAIAKDIQGTSFDPYFQEDNFQELIDLLVLNV